MTPKGLLANLRGKTPLVHFLTNYVTVNDCANITLACGASPIMADDAQELEDIVSLCSALVINIGTLNKRTLASMVQAGKHANRLAIPVVLDPAGAGASSFRNAAVTLLLSEVRFTAIQGNISEINFLSQGAGSTQGVDASSADLVSDANLKAAIRFAQKLSCMTASIISITGPIDIVASKDAGYALRNGHPMMAAVSGTGCMAAAVAGAFLAANPQRPLEAMLTAVSAMGICGEIAHEQLPPTGGNASLRNGIIDAMCQLTEDVLARRMILQEVL